MTSGQVSGMAARVAAVDWSSSPLGPAATWPQSLQTALSICLSSRFPLLVWWGPQLTVFYNDAYLPLLGTKHPRALGQPASETWAEAWGDLGPLAERVMAGGGATFSEDRLLFLERHGYLEETYWTFSYSPIRDESGGVGGVFTAVSDTTTRVIGERRLRILRELGELSAATAGTVAEACRGAIEVLARHRASVPFALAYVREDDGELRLVAGTGVRPGSDAAPDVLPADSPWRADDGEPITGLRDRWPGWFEPGPLGDTVPDRALAFPLTQAGDEQPVGLLVVGVNPYRELDRDYRSFFDLTAGHVATAVTDTLAYQAERRRAEALAELDRAKTEFFSNVSHEFRTPLTLIMGPLAELRARPEVERDGALREELDVIARNAERLGKLVNTLLDFSRLQSGRIDARFEPVDLAALTTELASVFRSAASRAGLDFIVDCPPLPAAVYLDRDMWERIVLNLLSNAVKYTFDGSITVRLRADDGAAVLTVADTGTGIPAEELPRLFERFHRVPHARARSGEGSGIGLAMVRELIALHGGTITADSEPGSGTTFTVRIPWGSAHLPADQLRQTHDAAAGPSDAAEPFISEALRWLPVPGDHPVEESAAPGRGRVLVADDNADMREYLHRLLAPRYAVRLATDGTEALEAALADPPDLVVSDVMMPGLDGMQLLSALRGDERTARVPVVLLSARAGQESSVEGLSAGADDYLVKPFAAGELLARVDAHLRLGRARQRETERQRLLAEVGTTLDTATDVEGQLSRLARLLVDHGLADVASVSHADRQPTGEADAVRRLTVPLTVRGRVLATLDLGRREGSPPYTEDERALGAEIGARAALSLDNAVLLAEERAAAVRLALLQRVTADLSAASSPVQVAEAAVDQVRQVIGDVGVIGFFEVDPRQQVLRRLAVLGTDQDDELWTELPLSTPLPVTVAARENRPLWPEEVHDGSETQPDWLDEIRNRLEIRSAAALPLTAFGRVVGVIGMGLSTARPLGDTDRAMLLAIAEQCAQALDRARLYRAEQNIAETLQHSLLPQRLPVLERLALAARYLAGAEGTQAGGDWYDVVDLGGSRVAIAVGDVVGQGPTAAAVMGQLRSALSTALLQGQSPAAALEVLDRFARRLPGAVASSAACVVLDCSSGDICWARAGHLPPLLVPRDPRDGVRVLDDGGPGTVLGVLSRPPFAEASTTLEPGDSLLLYTDGLVERRGQPVDTGIERLTAILRERGSLLPEPLATEVVQRALNGEQPDDVALIVARLLPAPVDERLPARPANLAALRRRVQAWSEAHGLAPDPAEDLQLALGEAVSNAVEHAYRDGTRGTVAIRLSVEGDAVQVLVRDFGRWREAPVDKGFRGRGLEMIGKLAHDLVVETPDDDAGGTRLTFSFPLPAGGTPVEGALHERPWAVSGTEAVETTLTAHRDREGLLLSIRGELDLATAASLRPAVLAELAAGPGDGSRRVTVDLGGTSYLASAGLGLLLEIADTVRRENVQLAVRAAPGSVAARVLGLAGLDTLLRPISPAG